ncbi:MAG: NTP transferase domain-containing protein [Clostridiales bacterium]|nr:NTP transferase domain-containing protein [Clostridiales bacterium]
MRALILAAGEGSRMRPHFSGPKPLIKLLGIPLIERNILSLRQCGIKDFFIVTGCYKKEIQDCLGNGERFNVNITYLDNPDWELGNGVSAYTFNRTYKENEKYIMMMADHIFNPDVFKSFVEQSNNITDEEILLAADKRLEKVWDLDESTKIKSQGDRAIKLGKELTDYDAVDSGLFLCTGALLNALKEAISNKQYGLTDAVNILASKGKVKLCFIEKDWVDVDDLESYVQAEKILLKSLIPAKDGAISKHINRKFSIPITKILSKTSITPNQITFLSFILAIISAFIFAFGNPIIAGLLAQLCSIMDGVDGEIARLKFLKTDYGGLFDAILDRYADFFIVIGMSYSLLMKTDSLPAFIICATVLTGIPMSMLIKEKYHAITGRAFVPEECDGIFRYLPANRDGRLFIIMLGGFLNLIPAALILLAVITHLQALARLVKLRKMI